jgi:hypothetical protein
MRALCVAACAAALSFAASPALAECCGSDPTVVYAAPPIVVVPPTGYVLDPSDAYRPVYVVNQGPMLPEPYIFDVAVPTYSEGGYAYPLRYPYVRSYYGDRWFTAPPRRFGWRAREGGEGRVSDPRVVRAGNGTGNYAPPYGAYRYRVAHGARVIHVQQDPK